ncbi:MAG: DUF1176 domain-containing protein [Roseitalea sp.]|nr:DUF1176 domain-containing protein [Roseitalea sp.]MBO6722272.1 DUF1176 domain-containing protein [Roseitalea sp.]MBO6742399.1 DUF1176 domain-containing protein [Roseitalea sp.]
MRQQPIQLPFGALAGLCLAVAGLVAAAMPVPADASQFKRIRDVNVSCTNALRCDMFITNARVTLFTVGFRRAAAFDAPVALYLTMREPLAAGSEVRFVIDGAEVLSVPSSAFSYRAAMSEYSYADQDEVRALFAATKAGERLQVTFRTRSGQTTAPYSLSGVVAGAIFMDEVQGRVGREDALAAIGAAPAAPEDEGDMAALDAVPAGLRRFYDGAGAPCADFDGSVPDPLGGFSADIDDEVRLVGLRCGSAGAYNAPFAFWAEIDGTHYRLPLPVMTDEGPGAVMVAWNAQWDAEARQVSSFFKGRGIGDCGTVANWSIGEVGFGYGFVLAEMRVKDECDGVFDETLESWERIWPSAGDKS